LHKRFLVTTLAICIASQGPVQTVLTFLAKHFGQKCAYLLTQSPGIFPVR